MYVCHLAGEHLFFNLILLERLWCNFNAAIVCVLDGGPLELGDKRGCLIDFLLLKESSVHVKRFFKGLGT